MQTAIDNATKLLSGVTGGYVVLHTNGSGQPYELLIMDTDDIETATKVWRWNEAGLGYSSTGYDGTYETAITADGQIVADFIVTGTIDASLAEIINLNASNITSGTIDASKITVKNLNASNITSGTLYASLIKLFGLMTVYQSKTSTTSGGQIGYGEGTDGAGNTTTGIMVKDATGKSYMICTNAGARLTYKGDSKGADAYVGAGYFEVDISSGTTKTAVILVDTNGMWLKNKAFLYAFKAGSTSQGYTLIGLSSSNAVEVGNSSCQLNIHENGTVNVDNTQAWQKEIVSFNQSSAISFTVTSNSDETVKWLHIGIDGTDIGYIKLDGLF